MVVIKFRGIPLEDVSDIDGADYDGKFVYGNYVKYGDSAVIVGDALEVGEDRFWPSWWVPVDPKTVGQFTGVEDVDGHDIYVGDEVESWSDASELTMEPKLYEVVDRGLFNNPGYYLSVVGVPHAVYPDLSFSFGLYRVVGTIYD